MNGKARKKDQLEISSDQLRAELIEIKERVGALETIASISNIAVLEKYVTTYLTTDKGRQIMKQCEQPRTRDYLKSTFGFASTQALDHHLNPLREADLLHQRFDDNGLQTFEWSKLFKGLPKKIMSRLLDGSK